MMSQALAEMPFTVALRESPHGGKVAIFTDLPNLKEPASSIGSASERVEDLIRCASPILSTAKHVIVDLTGLPVHGDGLCQLLLVMANRAESLTLITEEGMLPPAAKLHRVDFKNNVFCVSSLNDALTFNSVRNSCNQPLDKSLADQIADATIRDTRFAHIPTVEAKRAVLTFHREELADYTLVKVQSTDKKITNCDSLFEQLRDTVQGQKELSKPVHLDLKDINRISQAAAHTLAIFALSLSKLGIELRIVNPSDEVTETLKQIRSTKLKIAA